MLLLTYNSNIFESTLRHNITMDEIKRLTIILSQYVDLLRLVLSRLPNGHVQVNNELLNISDGWIKPVNYKSQWEIGDDCQFICNIVGCYCNFNFRTDVQELFVWGRDKWQWSADILQYTTADHCIENLMIFIDICATLSDSRLITMIVN